MDLSKIVVRAVNETRFRYLRSFYYKGGKGKGKIQVAEIMDPLAYPDYSEALYAFADNELASKLNFNNRGEWEHYPIGSLTTGDIARINGLAWSDRKEFGLLELEFRTSGTSYAKLRFGRFSNLVIGYDAYVPPALQAFFTLRSQFKSNLGIYALWENRYLDRAERDALVSGSRPDA